ncbi:MAG: hypothetical protein QW372_01600 [Nitrososphaerales archaeon]
MPFARTWSEEIIGEWLQLEGYLVEIGIPIPIPKTSGGRQEVDVAGARINGNTLEIFHIEVGSLPGDSQKNVAKLNKKFGSSVTNYLVDYFKQKLRFNGPYNKYDKLYVATYASQSTINTIKQQLGINIVYMKDFICQQIIQTIKNWKRKPYVTLPESLWLLGLIDYLNTNKKLKC